MVAWRCLTYYETEYYMCNTPAFTCVYRCSNVDSIENEMKLQNKFVVKFRHTNDIIFYCFVTTHMKYMCTYTHIHIVDCRPTFCG